MALAIDPINASDHRIRDLLRQLIRQKDGSLLPLPRALIASCMASYDIHLLGAVNSVLDMPQHVGRIRPKLEFRTILAFKMRYCERCLIDNPKSEWADGRYVAGWDFAQWFLRHYHKGALQPSDLMAVRQWLTQFFHKSPVAIRACLTTTILAEIMRERPIRTLFRDWEKRPSLNEAMQTALAQKSRSL